jgi:cysteine synthase A
VTQALAEKLPDLHRVAVEPAESPVLSGGSPGTHHVEGGGVGYWPPQLRADDFDEVMAIPEADGFAMARQAARTEGVFSGPSTGVNLVAALRVAARLGPGHRVVTVQVDSGLKYLSGDLYHEPYSKHSHM